MKIHSLLDKDYGEILYTSIDRSMIEELEMDEFFEMYAEECQAAVDEHYINMEEPDADTYSILRDNWYMLMNWIEDNWVIQETLLI